MTVLVMRRLIKAQDGPRNVNRDGHRTDAAEDFRSFILKTAIWGICLKICSEICSGAILQKVIPGEADLEPAAGLFRKRERICMQRWKSALKKRHSDVKRVFRCGTAAAGLPLYRWLSARSRDLKEREWIYTHPYRFLL